MSSSLASSRPSRTALLALVALLAGGSAGCYGRFALTRKLYNWNGQVTNNDFANSAIMWVLLIIPVYGVLGLVDFLVLNTIEVFTGSNPVAVNEDGSLELKRDGHVYVMRPTTQAGDVVEVARDGAPLYRYRKAGRLVVVEDLEGRTLKVIPEAQLRASAPAPTTF
jgi:hypothetical protein